MILIFLLFLPVVLFAQEEGEGTELSDPVDVDRLFDQAVVFEREGRFELAIDQYRRVLEEEPDNTAVLVRTAKLLSWTNQFDEALVLLDQALAKEPEMPEALFRKAQVLSWMERYPESIDLFKRFLESDPADPDGLAGLARVYFWSGRYNMAVETFGKAIEAGMNETAARIDLAKIYLAQHDSKSARKELEKALEINPDNQEARRLLEGIEILYTYELFPLSMQVNIYPDGTPGYFFNPGIIYHLKQTWDFSLINDIESIDGEIDDTVNLGVVYRGFQGMYLGFGAGFTPAASYNPYLSLKGSFHAALNDTVGAGITFKSDLFGEAESAIVQNDTLYEVNPEVATYFGDVSNIKLSGSWFHYASGYDTGRISLNAVVDYYKGNALSAGFSYGGSVETMDSDRRVIEFGFGIHQKITDLIDVSGFYNYIDTTYGLTHQVGLQTVLHW